MTVRCRTFVVPAQPPDPGDLEQGILSQHSTPILNDTICGNYNLIFAVTYVAVLLISFSVNHATLRLSQTAPRQAVASN